MLAGLCLSTAVNAQEPAVIDADYSAAMLSIMSEGEVPQEEPVEELAQQNVQEVAIQKESYTTDVLTVRALPGTEYEEVGKLAQYTKVQVTGVCDNGWSRVQMESGVVGFVSNEYLSDLVPAGAQNIGESMGVFTVTYYCACELCCGWWSGGPTASGAVFPRGVGHRQFSFPSFSSSFRHSNLLCAVFLRKFPPVKSIGGRISSRRS